MGGGIKFVHLPVKLQEKKVVHYLFFGTNEAYLISKLELTMDEIAQRTTRRSVSKPHKSPWDVAHFHQSLCLQGGTLPSHTICNTAFCME